MKTISARQFRLHFQELTEPVQVQRRRESGEYEIVGTWSPASTALTPDNLVTRIMEVSVVPTKAKPGEMDAHGAFGFHPVPKPGKR